MKTNDVIRLIERTGILEYNDKLVSHPDHYRTGKYEVIDIIDEFTKDDPNAYYVGNIIKYVLRYRKKNGLQDLKKAHWYLSRVIDILENEKENNNEN